MASPTLDERARFAAAVRRLTPMDDAAIDAVGRHLTAVDLARGASFLLAGDRATRAAVVLSGVLREFYPLADGGERTKGFAQESDFVGSLADLVADHPSRASIVAETDARLLVVPFRVFTAVATDTPAWRDFAAAITTRLYITKSEREYELLALDAAARHARFRERFPGLEARVSQVVVASYLGITPVHLSRIRSRQHRREGAAAGPATPRRRTPPRD
jgi:CRP-like cAMP-binding protein